MIADEEILITNLPEEILTEDQKSAIVVGLNLERLPFDQKMEVVDSLTGAVLNRVLVRVLINLSEKKLDLLAERMESWNSELALVEFLIVNVPSLDDIIIEEIEAVRGELENCLPEILAP